MINNSHKREYKKLFHKLKSHPINQWIIDKGWEWFPHQIQILALLATEEDIGTATTDFVQHPLDRKSVV